MDPRANHPIPYPLIHYSDAPLHHLRATDDPGDHHRPRGLWVSVGDAWLRYQRDIQAQTEWGSPHYPYKFRYSNEIVVRPDHNMLVVTNEEEFDAFNDAYSATVTEPYTKAEIRIIPWSLVRKDYDGILITPHLDSKAIRPKVSGGTTYVPSSRWYHTWVCASGCIWETSIVTSIKTKALELPEPPVQPKSTPVSLALARARSRLGG